ncbi:hypothetical protein COO60DRAFT_722411 [Scenedesmus sp. NREL 46B-D3]|nr:hypothetical protein COO60DRAFT_722411 [Scenedesmus sp. NREL 46B-D3]
MVCIGQIVCIVCCHYVHAVRSCRCMGRRLNCCLPSGSVLVLLALSMVAMDTYVWHGELLRHGELPRERLWKFSCITSVIPAGVSVSCGRMVLFVSEHECLLLPAM